MGAPFDLFIAEFARFFRALVLTVAKHE